MSGRCVIIFYNEEGNVSNIEIETTQYARNLTLRHKLDIEKRDFKVYRLGGLLSRCVREPSSGPTPRAGDSAIAPESEGSGLAEKLFGAKVRRNPPSA